MIYDLVFGSISVGLMLYFYAYLYNRTTWNPYTVWVTALSGTTFVIYGLDKLLSTISDFRASKNLLNLLALLGGFPGGWVGIAMFNHKTNREEHEGIWFWLTLSAFGHAALIYYWFFRGG